MMHVDRCPRADYNVRHWLTARPLAVETAVVALAYVLLLLFRPSLSSILWPNETHTHAHGMICVFGFCGKGGYSVSFKRFGFGRTWKWVFLIYVHWEKSGENRLKFFFVHFIDKSKYIRMRMWRHTLNTSEQCIRQREISTQITATTTIK